jgi:hypothetical protein
MEVRHMIGLALMSFGLRYSRDFGRTPLLQPIRGILIGLLLAPCIGGLCRADVDLSSALDAFEVACASVWSYDVILRIETFSEGQGAGESLGKISRQLFSDGQYRTELLSENGGEIRAGRVVAVFDGLKETSLRIRPKSTAAVIMPAMRAIDSMGGTPWGALFKELYPGLTYASLSRRRDSVLIPRPDKLVELLSPPDAVRGAPLGNVGFRIVFDHARGFMPLRIDYLLSRKNQLRLWTRFENELAEIEGGLWIPVRCRRTTYNVNVDGEESLGHDDIALDLSKSRFNQPIDVGEFSLEIPVGAQVDDQVNNISYVAGRDDPKDHLGELSRQGRVAMERLAANGLQPSALPRYRRWLIVANVLLIAGGLFFFIRRLNRR